MPELPELTPQHFGILVVRELRKVGLDVAELRIHRRATLPEPERGYLLELKGVLGAATWRPQALIACLRQQAPIGRAAVESLRDHAKEAGAEAGRLFGAADFDPEARAAALGGDRALLRVTDGRGARATSRSGAPGYGSSPAPRGARSRSCTSSPSSAPATRPSWCAGSMVRRRKRRSRRDCGPAESSGGASPRLHPGPRHTGRCREPGEGREPP